MIPSVFSYSWPLRAVVATLHYGLMLMDISKTNIPNSIICPS